MLGVQPDQSIRSPTGRGYKPAAHFRHEVLAVVFRVRGHRLRQQRTVATRAALDTPQDAAVVFDGHRRGRLAGRGAVGNDARLAARRFS